MPSVGYNTFFPKIEDSKFVIKNVTNKTIKIFGFKIAQNRSIDLMSLSYISEADIKHSLLKGDLQNKINLGEIEVTESNINLVQYNTNFIRYMQSAGLSTGLRDSGPDEMIITNLIDLPRPVNNVITLSEDNKIYYIKGLVDLEPNRIIVTGSNCEFIGRGPRNDAFIGSNAVNPLVEIRAGVQIKDVSFINPDGLALSIDGQTGGHAILRTVGFLNSGEGATFTNLNVLSMVTCMVKGCANGMTISDVEHTNINEFSFALNTGTATAITLPANSSYHSFNINNSFFFPESGQTSLSIDPSTSFLDRGIVSNSIFDGTGMGTELAGINKGDLQWWFSGNTGILDSRVIGSIGFSSSTPVAVTISVVNEWVPIEGPFTLSDSSERFSLDGYSLSYDGYYSYQTNILSVINIATATGNNITELALAINGIIDNTSVTSVEAKPTLETYTISSFATLETSDTISLWIRNTETTQDYDVRTIRITST